MRLLFDQNLSAVLVKRLGDLFPGSTHVVMVGLERAADDAIWAYAAGNGFVIVSKDSDFQQRSSLYGAPPKVIWIRIGNCTTDEIEQLLRKHSTTVHTFETESSNAMLVVSR
jgi:predicted nuclease of predicted toxin-antitoxin system